MLPKGSSWELEALCWEIWGLLGRSLDLIGSSLRVLGGYFGALGDGFGSIWADVRDLFLSLLRVLWKPASSSVSVVVGTFRFTSFANFAKCQGSFPLENSQLVCMFFSDARACEHEWNLSKTVLGQAPNSNEIPHENW
jgi:hypothetical protein